MRSNLREGISIPKRPSILDIPTRKVRGQGATKRMLINYRREAERSLPSARGREEHLIGQEPRKAYRRPGPRTGILTADGRSGRRIGGLAPLIIIICGRI